MHDSSLRKENIHDDLQEKYKHVYSSYEQRTKEALDLQGKVMELEKKVIELEAFNPKQTSESLGAQMDPGMQWGTVPHIQQGQLPPIAKKKNKVEEEWLKEIKDLKE